jgi:nucleotide-binding universal stress UspA family protein
VDRLRLGPPHLRALRRGRILRRAGLRDAATLAGDVEALYATRYLPAQAAYRDAARPDAHADVLVDNTDPDRPRVLRSRAECVPWHPGSGSSRMRPMAFERILVAYDGSRASRCAVEDVAGLAGDAEVTVLYVVPSRLTSLGRLPPTQDDLDRANALLREAYEALQARGVRVVAERVAGNAADEIVQEAKRRDVDLVAVGQHGKTFARLLLGSVSAKVVAEAPCDVLVVRPTR